VHFAVPYDDHDQYTIQLMCKASGAAAVFPLCADEKYRGLSLVLPDWQLFRKCCWEPKSWISLVSVSDCVVVLAAVGRLAQTETAIVVAELS